MAGLCSSVCILQRAGLLQFVQVTMSQRRQTSLSQLHGCSRRMKSKIPESKGTDGILLPTLKFELLNFQLKMKSIFTKNEV